MAQTDESVPDLVWWFSEYAEFEDFVGIGEERINVLVEGLRDRGISRYIINRLLKANGMRHGPTNSVEEAEGTW